MVPIPRSYRAGFATKGVGKSRQTHENVTETAPYLGLRSLPDGSQGRRHAGPNLQEVAQARSIAAHRVKTGPCGSWSFLLRNGVPIGNRDHAWRFWNKHLLSLACPRRIVKRSRIDHPPIPLPVHYEPWTRWGRCQSSIWQMDNGSLRGTHNAQPPRQGFDEHERLPTEQVHATELHLAQEHARRVDKSVSGNGRAGFTATGLL